MFSSNSSSQQTISLETEFNMVQNRYSHKNKLEALDLQDKARSNLCELSNTICQDHFVAKDKKILTEISHYNFSPWRPKDQQKNIKIHQQNTIKKYSQTAENHKAIKSKQNTSHFQDQKQNQVNIKAFHQDQKLECDIKKYPSVFIKLMAAKQYKNNTKSLIQNHEIEIVTIMKRKKSQKTAVKKDILSEKIQSIINFNRNLSKQGFSLQNIKDREVKEVKYPKQHRQYNLMQLENVQWDKENKQILLKNEYWKVRNVNIKNRITKKNAGKLAKSIQKNDVRQANSMKKKESISLQRTKKQEYQSSNPLTRLLYQKYIHTISLNNYNSREQKGKFL